MNEPIEMSSSSDHLNDYNLLDLDELNDIDLTEFDLEANPKETSTKLKRVRRNSKKIGKNDSEITLDEKKKLKAAWSNFLRGIRYSRDASGFFDSISKEKADQLGYKWIGKTCVLKFGKAAAQNCSWIAENCQKLL